MGVLAIQIRHGSLLTSWRMPANSILSVNVDGFDLVGAFFVAKVAIGACAICNGANAITLGAHDGDKEGAT